MLEVGRVCVKVLVREAGKKCVVVEKANENFVASHTLIVKIKTENKDKIGVMIR